MKVKTFVDNSFDKNSSDPIFLASSIFRPLISAPRIISKKKTSDVVVINQSKENQPPLIIKAAPVKSAAKKAIQRVSQGGGKGLFTCKVCEKSFVDMRTFSLHLETHSAQKLAENYVQSNPRNPGILKANGGSQLNLGKLTKGGKATFTCPHCSTAFTDKVIYDRYTHSLQHYVRN